MIKIACCQNVFSKSFLWRRGRFSLRMFASVALCALSMMGGVVASSSVAQAQASVLIKHQSTTAVVETIDRQAREILLREKSGHLITVEYGEDVRDLPHLHEGDSLIISFVETLGAEIAPPGSPMPESTIATARGFVHGHPHGVIAVFNRERAFVRGINLKTHTLTFLPDDKDDRELRVVVFRTRAMRDFLSTLKVGDVVDMTRMESLSYVITNTPVARHVPAQVSLQGKARVAVTVSH